MFRDLRPELRNKLVQLLERVLLEERLGLREQREHARCRGLWTGHHNVCIESTSKSRGRYARPPAQRRVSSHRACMCLHHPFPARHASGALPTLFAVNHSL